MKIVKTTSVATDAELELIEQRIASGDLYVAGYVNGVRVIAQTLNDGAKPDLSKVIASLQKMKGLTDD
jgi:hypothetical protein